MLLFHPKSQVLGTSASDGVASVSFDGFGRSGYSCALVDKHGAQRLACHFHDTRALGLANVYAAIESGVRRFDASVGGLGGCPFAPVAKGNVATEDVVMLCEQMGYATGVSIPKLLAAVEQVGNMLGTPQGGRAHYWLSQNAA